VGSDIEVEELVVGFGPECGGFWVWFGLAWEASRSGDDPALECIVEVFGTFNVFKGLLVSWDPAGPAVDPAAVPGPIDELLRFCAELGLDPNPAPTDALLNLGRCCCCCCCCDWFCDLSCECG